MILIVVYSCEREISISEPQEFEVGIANYVIKTVPEGARIYYDNKFTGKTTPDTVNWITKGTHKFRVQLFPFLDYEFSDEIISDSLFEKTYDFNSNPLNSGSIKFLTNPNGCKIYLDDKLLTFQTPYTLNDVKLGNHKIKFTYPSHRSDSLNVFVHPQKQVLAEKYLEDTTKWVYYNTKNSDLTDNTITDICIDENDVFWVGTDLRGLIKITNGRKEFININNSNLAGNSVNRIKIDDYGNVWVATDDGISMISGNSIKSYTVLNSGLPNNLVWDLDFDEKGNIWIATDNGLARFKDDIWKVFNTNNSWIPTNGITAVTVINRYQIWVGANKYYTILFDGISKWEPYQADYLLVGDSVSDIIIGHDNEVWIGLRTEFDYPSQAAVPGGVYNLDVGFLVEKDFRLADKSVNRFFKESDKLWIATRSGILEVNTIYDFKLHSAGSSGLPVNNVLAIAKSANGNMWFGTKGGGLVKYKVASEE